MKVLVTIIICLSSSTLAFFNSGNRLRFFNSKFYFYTDDQNSYLSAHGIWELNNPNNSISPHAAEINCDRYSKICNKTEVWTRTYDKDIYITHSTVDFDIIYWDKTQIIAKGNEGLCFTGILNIDIKNEKINLTSKIKSQKGICKRFKELDNYLEVKNLVDGENLYINIGNSKVVWSKD